MKERRTGIIDRRRNFRSPFTERRKRNAIAVFQYEINKLCIVASIKKRLKDAFSDFVSTLKTSPRNLKQNEILNYLNSLPSNKQSAASSALEFLYVQLYGFYDFDDIFNKFIEITLINPQYSGYITKFIDMLKLKNYSQKTLKNYKNHLIAILNHFDKKPESITSDDIKNYILLQKEIKNISASTQSAIISSYKFFAYYVLESKLELGKIPYPKKPQRLPKVMNVTDVQKFLKIAESSNIKYYAIFLIVYASGLRISEVVRIRLQQIDIERGTLLILNSKGKKDRYTIFSAKIMNSIKKYLDIFKPETWLFYSANNKKNHLSDASVGKMFIKYKNMSGINPYATTHIR